MMQSSSLFCLVFLVSTAVAAAAEQPDADPETRSIAGLSETQREGYAAGQGMGMALAAELNGYPGPRHVLDLAEELNLSTEQIDRTQALFESMQAEAREIGAEVVEVEQRLDNLFASGDVTPEDVSDLTRQIGELKGRLRNAHLQTHITQHGILTTEQNEAYQQLRGYHEERRHREHMAH